jgi:hypothetical protein
VSTASLHLSLSHRPIQTAPGSLLQSYWGSHGAFRPTVDLFLCGPGGLVTSRPAVIDTGSAYIAFDEPVAIDVGLQPPFNRVVHAQGAGGAPFDLTFPADGDIRILLTDHVTGYIVWAPPVGFLRTSSSAPRGPNIRRRTGVLGFTGFLQHLDIAFLSGGNPSIEITVPDTFPGVVGHGRPPGNVWDQLPPS